MGLIILCIGLASVVGVLWQWNKQKPKKEKK